MLCKFDARLVRTQTPEWPYHVLFLCTGNSARSILGEAILNKIGAGNFVAYSAGSQPKGEVNPYALTLLQRLGYATDELRSKSWDEFAKPGASHLDFVFTVCDNAAKEVCPVWPGQPITAHWGIPDPAAVHGPDPKIMFAFRDAYDVLKRRIELFTNLPVRTLDPISLQNRLREIGQSMSIRPLSEADSRWSGMLTALRAADLPTADLSEGGARYFVLGNGDAFGGMALFGDVALLRSMVVAGNRGSGTGSALLRELLGIARGQGVREVWLLTTSAERFFAKHHFVPAARADAPEAIAATSQFQGVCPASATLMRLALA